VEPKRVHGSSLGVGNSLTIEIIGGPECDWTLKPGWEESPDKLRKGEGAALEPCATKMSIQVARSIQCRKGSLSLPACRDTTLDVTWEMFGYGELRKSRIN